jgi:hypothetical protein
MKFLQSVLFSLCLTVVLASKSQANDRDQRLPQLLGSFIKNAGAIEFVPLGQESGSVNVSFFRSDLQKIVESSAEGTLFKVFAIVGCSAQESKRCRIDIRLLKIVKEALKENVQMTGIFVRNDLGQIQFVPFALVHGGKNYIRTLFMHGGQETQAEEIIANPNSFSAYVSGSYVYHNGKYFFLAEQVEKISNTGTSGASVGN